MRECTNGRPGLLGQIAGVFHTALFRVLAPHRGVSDGDVASSNAAAWSVKRASELRSVLRCLGELVGVTSDERMQGVIGAA